MLDTVHCNGTVAGTLAIQYIMVCTTNPTTGNPSLVVIRLWNRASYNIVSPIWVYGGSICQTQMGTFPCQEAFDPLGCLGIGQDCSFAYFDIGPGLAIDPCSAFSISGALTPGVPGSPTTTCSTPQTSDPVGGTIAIS